MLKMRLQRIGRKNDASFRVVVTDSRRGPKSGKHVDLLGSYNPKMNRVQIDGDKAKDWIAKGVQLSDTVHNLLINEKIIAGKKINVLPKKAPIVDEEKLKAEAEAKAAEEAAAAAEEASGEAADTNDTVPDAAPKEVAVETDTVPQTEEEKTSDTETPAETPADTEEEKKTE